jgi:Uncharacterized protein conserved in bacteria
MNYLVHAYLSFGHEQRLIGNLLGDFVKGKQYLHYEPTIQQGVFLHRFIDRFTDSHSLIIEANRLFYPDFRLSAGIINDVLFDHFFRNDSRYVDQYRLQLLISSIYQTVMKYQTIIPEKGIYFFDKMKEHNWLMEY